MVLSSFIMLTIMIVMFLVFFIGAASNNTEPMLEKKVQFECGFNKAGKSKGSFSTKFFLIMILFLVFDLEIAILLPTTSLKSSVYTNAISAMSFIIIITIAMIIEWVNGIIEWSS